MMEMTAHEHLFVYACRLERTKKEGRKEMSRLDVKYWRGSVW